MFCYNKISHSLFGTVMTLNDKVKLSNDNHNEKVHTIHLWGKIYFFPSFQAEWLERRLLKAHWASLQQNIFKFGTKKKHIILQQKWRKTGIWTEITERRCFKIVNIQWNLWAILFGLFFLRIVSMKGFVPRKLLNTKEIHFPNYAQK